MLNTKKLWKAISVGLCGAALTVMLAGCGADNNSAVDKDITKGRVLQGEAAYETWFNSVHQPSGLATYYTVTFDTDGGTVIPSEAVRSGNKATKPADPTKEGYTFDDWYAEDTFTTVFDFGDPITADTTIYAKFTS